jgi:hypothetical protein
MRTNQNSLETVTIRLSDDVGSFGRPMAHKLPVRFLEIRPVLQVTQRKLCAHPVPAEDNGRILGDNNSCSALGLRFDCNTDGYFGVDVTLYRGNSQRPTARCMIRACMARGVNRKEK